MCVDPAQCSVLLWCYLCVRLSPPPRPSRFPSTSPPRTARPLGPYPQREPRVYGAGVLASRGGSRRQRGGKVPGRHFPAREPRARFPVGVGG